MNIWIDKQFTRQLAQWSAATGNVSNAEIWTDPVKHLTFITDKANTLKAAKCLDWPQYLSNVSGNIVVDLGCGTGWLGAYLSTFASVKKIYSVDTDEAMLQNMVPRMFELMGGDFSKAELVRGLFEPILMEDESVDLIVASSAFHHSENLLNVLRECRRVLRPGGTLVILNENPISKLKYLMIWMRKFIHMTYKIAVGRVDERFQKLSYVGILYDPNLGDWDYSRTAWHTYLTMAGFRFHECDTRLRPYNFRKCQHTLKHFICRPTH